MSGIEESEIENAIDFPNKIAHDNDLCIAMKLRENEHLLLVIYTENITVRKIITVIDTSKVDKYLQRYA